MIKYSTFLSRRLPSAGRIAATIVVLGSGVAAFAQFGIPPGPSTFVLDPDFARPEELRVVLTTDKREYAPLEVVRFTVTVTNVGNRVVKTRRPHNYRGTVGCRVRRLSETDDARFPKLETFDGRGGPTEILSLRPGESCQTEFAWTEGPLPSIEGQYAPGRVVAQAVYLCGNYGGADNDPPAECILSNLAEFHIRPQESAEQKEYKEFILARGDNDSFDSSEAIRRMMQYLEDHPKSRYRRVGRQRILDKSYSIKQWNEVARICQDLRNESLPAEAIENLWIVEAEVHIDRGEFERAYRLLQSAEKTSGFRVRWKREFLEEHHGPFPDRPVASVPPPATPLETPTPTSVVAAAVPSASNSPAWQGWLIVLVVVTLIVGLAARSRRRAT